MAWYCSEGPTIEEARQEYLNEMKDYPIDLATKCVDEFIACNNQGGSAPLGSHMGYRMTFRSDIQQIKGMIEHLTEKKQEWINHFSEEDPQLVEQVVDQFIEEYVEFEGEYTDGEKHYRIENYNLEYWKDDYLVDKIREMLASKN